MWNIILSIILGIVLFTALGHRIGRFLFPSESKGTATLIGAMVAIALFSILGACTYYILPVTQWSFGILAILIAIGIFVLVPKTKQKTEKQIELPSGIAITGAIIALLANGAWWSVLLTHPITDAVRTPWLVISPVTIIAPAIALLASTIVFRASKTLGTILFATTFFSMLSSAAILFPLGYGFDPFLHRATILHIAQYGTITPKPLYYIGEYALELFAYLLGNIPLLPLDALLIPVLATLTFTIALRRLPHATALLLLPLGAFITTTPQSLGYLFALLTVLTTESKPESWRAYIAPSIFAIAALFAHPIAGVPACFFILFLLIQHQKLRFILATASAAALPALFIVQAKLNHAQIGFSWNTLWRLDQLPLTHFFSSQGNAWLDALYLITGNLSTLAIIFAIIGVITTRKNRTTSERNGTIVAGTLVLSFIFVSLGIDFTYLISYERQDFALRFLTLATIFALPIIDRGIEKIAISLEQKNLQIITSFAIFALGCAATYNMFPHHDGYQRSAAFNVSQADINSVYAIHTKESEDADYIVLSNQTTAAAALQEFGFRKYYHTDMFYYPIPTGGVLYQYYLSMVNEAPLATTMQKAMNTAGVSRAYFVVNDYWWKSDAIIEQTKQQTDDWFAVDEGKVTIFVFKSDE